MTSLKYGILGSGMMGQEHIKNLALLDGSEVAGLYDPDKEMLRSANDLVPNAKVAGSMAELVTDPNIDCLVIATPNFLHAEQLKSIAELRTLPILVEKPLVTKPDDLKFIQSLEQSYGAPIWVAMEYRYMPPLALFLERMEDITGGVKHLSIREHRFPFLSKVNDWNRFNRFSGGTLVEKCCHFFDLMRLITGSEAKAISASGWQANNHIEERYDGEQPDIWDAAFVMSEFHSGTRAMLDLCMFAEGSQYQEEIVAAGPKGKIECLIPGPARFWPNDAGPQPLPKVVISSRERGNREEIEVPVDQELQIAGDHNGSTYYQHQKFRDVVLNNGNPEVSLKDGSLAVAMGMCAQEASITNSVVHFDNWLSHNARR